MALEKGIRAYAKDQHFELMARLIGLRPYTPGYGGRYEPDVEA